MNRRLEAGGGGGAAGASSSCRSHTEPGEHRPARHHAQGRGRRRARGLCFGNGRGGLRGVERLPHAGRQRHPDLVAAAELGVVDGRVGGVQQAVDGVGVLGIGGDAHADRDLEVLARVVLRAELHRRHPAAGGLGHLDGGRDRGARQHQAELLAAEAGRDAALTAEVAEQVRDPPDQPVAGQVALRVVHDAQVVEVDHQHRQVEPVPARRGERVAHQLVQVLGVVEAGLRVRARLVLEQGHPERPVDEQHGPGRQQRQGVVRQPEGRQAGAGQSERSVQRHRLECVLQAGAQRPLVRERHDQRQQQVVGPHESDHGSDQRDCAKAVRACRRAGLHHRVGREARQQVVGDVEAHHVPAEPVRDPAGHEAGGRQQRDRPGRQDDRAPEEEDEVRLEGVVPRRKDLEEVCECAERDQADQQRRVHLGAVGREGQHACKRACDQRSYVQPRSPREIAEGRGGGPDHRRSSILGSAPA